MAERGDRTKHDDLASFAMKVVVTALSVGMVLVLVQASRSVSIVEGSAKVTRRNDRQLDRVEKALEALRECACPAVRVPAAVNINTAHGGD